MTEESWLERSRPFLEAIDVWYQNLPAIRLKDITLNPARVAVFGVDLVAGLAAEGPLASPRLAAVVPHIVALFQQAYGQGVRYFLLPQGRYPEAAIVPGVVDPEQASWELRTLPALQQLPFANLFQVLSKKSTHPALETNLDEWVNVHTGVSSYVIVGNCTDLGVYQLALHLRLRANVQGWQRRIVVPANCVATYDRSAERAREAGGLPHNGDLLHRVFLYHLATYGIEIVSEVI